MSFVWFFTAHGAGFLCANPRNEGRPARPTFSTPGVMPQPPCFRPAPPKSVAVFALWILLAHCATASPEPAEPGLLFHLSGQKGLVADRAAIGTHEPNFSRDVHVIAGGARGAGIRCEHTQMLSYWAPGNIHAQRGTLSFFWRAREATGPTEFPVFRVGYDDHSSWDMVWLRIDYNGHGFDAFVTDINLARTRVSITLQPFPKPDEWTHLALAWDETDGIRFYVDGRLAGRAPANARYDAALDQFGPHSRVISPYRVQSDYNFVRGGDIDEIRIYDRALDDERIATLAAGGGLPDLAPLPARSLDNPRWRDEWNFRYGWNRAGDPPPALDRSFASVRKVEIHDTYDLKRWWWKANDGLRETTWPGVYNRSRLPGRNDYFQLPDWDCYTLSGRSVTFTLPDEPWNQLEISGSAWGRMTLLASPKPGDATAPATGPAPGSEVVLFERPRAQEKTIHRLAGGSVTGGSLRFDNTEPEEPIGELSALFVSDAREPAASPGVFSIAYRPSAIRPDLAGADVATLARFIAGRHPEDEQTIVIAEPAEPPPATPAHTPATIAPPPAAIPATGAPAASSHPAAALPLLHLLIPAKYDAPGYDLPAVDGALDGIALDLPAWTPRTAGLVSFNIRVKDPLWPQRDMLDFTFSADPRSPRTLWLDLRDRILPPGRSIYLTIAASESPATVAALAPVVRLVFKPRAAGRAEHEIDRFTQARDNYAMLVEEYPSDRRYRKWARFEDELGDLLRVNPEHIPGRNYRAVAFPASPRPPFAQPVPPAGTPLWAFRQVEWLRHTKELVLWYIDHRQIEDGEFGGGLSDDSDLLNQWPGIALMGGEPDKIAASNRRLLEACYAQGLFTRGLSTIQTDELHSYEEGINALGQMLVLDYASPRQLERAMATTRALFEVTGINTAGHRHFRSSYYSGSRMATDSVWGWSKSYSHLVLQPAMQLAEFNGNPEARRLVVELATGLLAHRKHNNDGSHSIPTAVHFESDQEGPGSRDYNLSALFWTAWRWTGDRACLDPILDRGPSSLGSVNANALDLLSLRDTWGPALRESEHRASEATTRSRTPTYSETHFAWQLTGDKHLLERLYGDQLENFALREYINTEGSLWIDRVNFSTAELQRARLGGVALSRNAIFPGHTVSWRFHPPATEQSVAILIPDATPTAFTVIAFNLESAPVHATLTAWNIDPGQWQLVQGIDTHDRDVADTGITTSTIELERTRNLELTLPPRATTILTFKLLKPGPPYWGRPDLGLDREDIVRSENTLTVTVHSLGSVDAPAATLAVVDRTGKTLASAAIPALAAPNDLRPKTTAITLSLPDGADLAGCRIVIDPDRRLGEITTRNNAVDW